MILYILINELFIKEYYFIDKANTFLQVKYQLNRITFNVLYLLP